MAELVFMFAVALIQLLGLAIVLHGVIVSLKKSLFATAMPVRLYAVGTHR